MKKKAIIYDLDNTIYSVKTIGWELLAPLFKIVSEAGYQGEIDKIKVDLMSKPFQVVARKYRFGEALKQACVNLLKQLTYKGKIETYEDYYEIKSIPSDRFLVTTGFNRLQWSKIRALNIENDFIEIHVVDPSNSPKTKKDVFRDILDRKYFTVEDLLVVGDDPQSEIKAGLELGIETVLYDRENEYPKTKADFKINNFRELKEWLIWKEMVCLKI